jgi:hypothetical protein
VGCVTNRSSRSFWVSLEAAAGREAYLIVMFPGKGSV